MDGEDAQENTYSRMSLRERPRKERNLRTRNELRSMNEDYPDKNNKDKRKGRGKVKFSYYDEYGNIKYNGLDVCDCMDETCPGCWNECVNCSSFKCGVQCRVNRKFYYESISYDGMDTVIKNKYFPAN